MRTTSCEKVRDRDGYQMCFAPEAGALQLFIDPSLARGGRPSVGPRTGEVACRATYVHPPPWGLRHMQGRHGRWTQR